MKLQYSRATTLFSGRLKELLLVLAAFSGVLMICIIWFGDKGGLDAECSNLIQRSLEQAYSRFDGIVEFMSTSKDSKLQLGMQRNLLSKQLNDMKKLVGQYSCREIELRRKLGENMDRTISASGGWCAEDSSIKSTEHVFDENFAKALGELLKGKKVASFGEGPGLYKNYFEKGRQLQSYTAYDGAPFCEKTTLGQVMFLDLTSPQYGLGSYDWVVSVEVGEHIPAKFESVYIDNLVRHAKEGLVISWAAPGQGGLAHVNNKSQKDVAKIMSSLGFEMDVQSSEMIRKGASTSWLQKNLMVFRRRDSTTFCVDDV